MQNPHFPYISIREFPTTRSCSRCSLMILSCRSLPNSTTPCSHTPSTCMKNSLVWLLHSPAPFYQNAPKQRDQDLAGCSQGGLNSKKPWSYLATPQRPCLPLEDLLYLAYMSMKLLPTITSCTSPFLMSWSCTTLPWMWCPVCHTLLLYTNTLPSLG